MTNRDRTRNPQQKKSPTHRQSKGTGRLPRGRGREALLEAAVRAVARDGPSGLTYRAVAKEAGVTHSLVHYHFGSREALITEAYKWAVSKVIEKMHVVAKETWLHDYAESLVNISPEDGELHIFLNSLVLDACRHAEKRKYVEPVFVEVGKATGKALEAAHIPTTPALAQMVLSTLIGVTMQHQALASPKNTRKILQALGDVLDAWREVNEE